MPMTMHQRGRLNRNLDLEDANGFIFQNEVMRGLSGDLDLRRRLRQDEWNKQKKKQDALHGREL